LLNVISLALNEALDDKLGCFLVHQLWLKLDDGVAK
jgi:hypothetical protein